jgi:hypothetical protein
VRVFRDATATVRTHLSLLPHRRRLAITCFHRTNQASFYGRSASCDNGASPPPTTPASRSTCSAI